MHAIKRFRTLAFHAQQGRCYYCRAPMWLNDPDSFRRIYGCTAGQLPSLRATAEHIVARCDGGKNTQANIVAAHCLCNRRRHQPKTPLPADRYLARVSRGMADKKWLPASFIQALGRHISRPRASSSTDPVNT